MPYLDAAGWVQRGESGQSIVALGGGHGLSATLRALRHITRALTAVVCDGDDSCQGAGDVAKSPQGGGQAVPAT